MLNFRYGFIFVLLLGGLVACGGGGTKSPTPQPPTTPAPGGEPSVRVAPGHAETDDATQVGLRYQAEAQFISGNVTAAESYVSEFSDQGDRLIFTVHTDTASVAGAGVRYANTTSVDQTLGVYVNGLKIQNLVFPATGSDEWGTVELELSLRAGINSISLQVDAEAAGDVYIGSLYVQNATAIAEQGKAAVYITLEAETLTTNGEVLAADTTYKTIASESSNRQAVRLTNTGDYIEFTASAAASGLVLRYAMPDSGDGAGLDTSLGLYVNGERQSLGVSSKHAWVYGAYPYNNNPSDGEAHRFYDESAYRVNIPVDATVRIQKDEQDSAEYYVIDLIELEDIAEEIAAPEGYLDITASPYFADATGVQDATSAIVTAIADAKSQNTGVYIPAGVFSIGNRVSVSNVHIQGAGIWYSTIMGRDGKGGFLGAGSNVTLTDLKIASDTKVRRDSEDHGGIEGNFGTNSLIQNVWIEHMKVGGWVANGTDGLLMLNGRVRNTYADGFNFHYGVLNSQISHFNVRNTGDDSFDMWAESTAPSPNTNNTFSYNTAQLPMLANTYAIYGGRDNKLLNNIGMDTVVSSAGIALSQRFNPYPFAGTTVVKNNSLYRTGGWDYGWNTSFGAVWVFTDNSPITGVLQIDNLTIVDAVYDGILVSYNQNVDYLNIANTSIDGTGWFGLRVAVTGGEMLLENVTVENAAQGGMENNGITLIEQGVNSGF